MKTIYSQPYRRLIDELTKARNGARLTQTAAGQRLGLSRNAISKIELCECRLDVCRYVLLCHAYSVKPVALIAKLEQWMAE